MKDDLFKTGVGFVLPNQKGFLWGRYFMPLPIIRSWRTAQLLKNVLFLNEKTLCFCWELTKPVLSIRDSFFVKKLENQIDGDVMQIRNKLMQDVPTVEMVVSMARRAKYYGIDIDARDISREIEKGKLPPGTLVEALS